MTLKKGKLGEQHALNYLLHEKKHQLKATNWRYHHLEVDIITKDGNTLVFTEVKTRETNDFGNPEDFISLKQQRNLINAADAYIQEKDFDGESRFDAISVLINRAGKVKLYHIEEAFRPFA